MSERKSMIRSANMVNRAKGKCEKERAKGKRKREERKPIKVVRKEINWRPRKHENKVLKYSEKKRERGKKYLFPCPLRQ
jgi:hypothetical protein